MIAINEMSVWTKTSFVVINSLFLIPIIIINMIILRKNEVLIYDNTIGVICLLIFASLLTLVEYFILNIILFYIIIMIIKTINFCQTLFFQRKTNKIINNEVELTIDYDCCICLDNIENGIILKCKHVLHKECLKEMIESELTNCPLCRQDIV